MPAAEVWNLSCQVQPINLCQLKDNRNMPAKLQNEWTLLLLFHFKQNMLGPNATSMLVTPNGFEYREAEYIGIIKDLYAQNISLKSRINQNHNACAPSRNTVQILPPHRTNSRNNHSPSPEVRVSRGIAVISSPQKPAICHSLHPLQPLHILQNSGHFDKSYEKRNDGVQIPRNIPVSSQPQYIQKPHQAVLRVAPENMAFSRVSEVDRTSLANRSGMNMSGSGFNPREMFQNIMRKTSQTNEQNDHFGHQCSLKQSIRPNQNRAPQIPEFPQKAQQLVNYSSNIQLKKQIAPKQLQLAVPLQRLNHHSEQQMVEEGQIYQNCNQQIQFLHGVNIRPSDLSDPKNSENNSQNCGSKKSLQADIPSEEAEADQSSSSPHSSHSLASLNNHKTNVEQTNIQNWSIEAGQEKKRRLVDSLTYKHGYGSNIYAKHGDSSRENTKKFLASLSDFAVTRNVSNGTYA